MFFQLTGFEEIGMELGSLCLLSPLLRGSITITNAEVRDMFAMMASALTHLKVLALELLNRSQARLFIIAAYVKACCSLDSRPPA